MQIRVIKHIRKVYACTASVTADKPGSSDRKNYGQPQRVDHVADHQILRRFTAAPFRNGAESATVSFSRGKTLGRWVISAQHLQPLLNLIRNRLLEIPVIHCDETRVQRLKKSDRDPASRSLAETPSTYNHH